MSEEEKQKQAEAEFKVGQTTEAEAAQQEVCMPFCLQTGQEPYILLIKPCN
jgi:hypothetical protein